MEVDFLFDVGKGTSNASSRVWLDLTQCSDSQIPLEVCALINYRSNAPPIYNVELTLNTNEGLQIVSVPTTSYLFAIEGVPFIYHNHIKRAG